MKSNQKPETSNEKIEPLTDAEQAHVAGGQSRIISRDAMYNSKPNPAPPRSGKPYTKGCPTRRC